MKAFGNTVGKREMLDTSILSFIHNLLYPSLHNFQIFSHVRILSSANAFNLDQSKILCFDKELAASYQIQYKETGYEVDKLSTLSQTTNFRLFQTE